MTGKPVADATSPPVWGAPPTTGASKDTPLDLALGGFSAESDMAACLVPLLQGLGWRGNPRHVAEALPHFADTLDLTDLRNVMATLNYSSRGARMHMREIEPRLLPCLFVPDKGAAMVLLAVNDQGLEVFDGGTRERRVITNPRGRGRAYFFTRVREDAGQRQAQTMRGWFISIMERFRPLMWQTLGMTALSNMLAISTPLFVMAVYDKVVGSGSSQTLKYLLLGVLIALTGDLALRIVRARIIAFIGARIDHIVGIGVFQRLLFLAPGYTEKATVGAQVSRLKDFESVREFFVGPLAMVFFEMPFVILHLVVIGVLGTFVAVVPVVAILIFLFLGSAFLPIVRNRNAVAAKATSQRQDFLVEAFMKMRAVKEAGAEDVWYERYRELSAEASFASYRARRIRVLLTVSSHLVVVMSGLATMGVGTVQVLHQGMSVGALIACMILTWRVLAPLQTGFMTFTQLQQIRASINQVNQLMNLRPEHESYREVGAPKRFKGRVTFGRVSLRYSAEADPALIGVSFTADPGEVVAVIGPNGAGKSTLLKLVAGMYLPQAGNVRIDGIDIRQLDPVELRAGIGYVPQQPQLFFGSIAQNLRLAHPTATDAELEWAVDQAGCLEDIRALPEGFNTRVGDNRSDQVAASLAQRLSLARAYLKRAPIMLFDEPVNGLDFAGDRRFMQTVEEMRGHATVFIVTHRPSHLRMADRILLLDQGYVRLAGPAQEVLDRIPKELL